MAAPIVLPPTEHKLFERSNPTFHRPAWHDQWFVITEEALYVATLVLWSFTSVQRFPLHELQQLNIVPIPGPSIVIVAALYTAAAVPAIGWCVRVIHGAPLQLWPPPGAILLSLFLAYLAHLYRRSNEGRHALRIVSSRETFTVKSPRDTYIAEKVHDRKLLLDVVKACEEIRDHGTTSLPSV